jgi:mono/diheme cytochrome c family protein
LSFGRNVTLLGLCSFAFAASCAQEEMPQSVWDSRHPGTAAATRPDSGPALEDGGEPAAPGQCVQALAQALPARIAVTSSAAGRPSSAPRVVTVEQIYQQLWPHCAKCHAMGNAFTITDGTDFASPGGESFASKGEEALHHIESSGTTVGARDEAMPPIDPTMGTEGLGWNVLTQMFPNHPIVQAAHLLEAWVSAGKKNSFPIGTAPAAGDRANDAGGDAGGAEGGAPGGYLMSTAVGNGMTNLGNCVPDPSIVATEQPASAALDEKFAKLKRLAFGDGTLADVIGLPEKLSETDLTTWDGDALARMGVIAFDPQYPLWSDDAGKLRFVRVPRGQSIYFDKATQEFQIPPNTRFYKTFLKRIIDTDGNPSWRKIETRLIVARPDTVGPDGKTVQNALYGSYLWNPDETDAVLLGTGDAAHDFVVTGDSLLKEEDGFTDTVLVYETNVNTHAIRHYAVPSSARCVQCHMGSASQDFILGFRPVQLLHRPVGQEGIIEASGTDELSLLQRLVDYGIVTGIDSLADVLPLSRSQGDRLPRNDQELTAQGYMLGNCVHCHNPRGFPSVTFPVLTDVFNLLPGPTGGIFQFPLEKVSPRITRGFNGNVLIPYVTPSLVDNPSFPPTLDPNSGDTQHTIGQGSAWKPKWMPGGGVPGQPAFVYAPWRSLIFRNVDTPFTYTDDFAIYPHMPMNTPGYDDRAKQIMGDWMVSIPAIRKRADIDEYVQPYDLINSNYCSDYDPVQCLNGARTNSDPSVQPYVEVKPGAPQYDAAFAAAQQRLATFHSGARPAEVMDLSADQDRYASFSTFANDIVDTTVDPVCRPTPDEVEAPLLNIPTHAHWVPLDLTQSPGDWVPRRKDWQTVFSMGVTPASTSGCSLGQADVVAAAQANEQCVVNMLKGDDSPVMNSQANTVRQCATKNYDGTKSAVSLDSIRHFATTPFPMGLWDNKPACDWTRDPWKSQGPSVADVLASDPHPWLQGPAGADSTRHVYKQTPGEAVFSMICINCHGPQADSHGRLADNLATMTGGNALVADLRDGFFGPASSPGSNRNRVFASDDTASHYMAWMALGGTQVVIPPAYLTIIGQTPVFGHSRPGGLPPPGSANMLSVARELCLQTLIARPFACGQSGKDASFYSGSQDDPKAIVPLLFNTGDAELWLKLCSFNNPPPVVPYYLDASLQCKELPSHVDSVHADRALLLSPPIDILPDAFETGCPSTGGVQTSCVGDENGNAFSRLTADNHHPWCVLSTNAYAEGKVNQTAIDRLLQSRCTGGTDCDASGNCKGAFPDSNCVYWPVCPKADPATGNFALDDDYGTAALHWAQRGAINAGLSVFLYLDSVTKGTYKVKPDYKSCDALTK